MIAKSQLISKCLLGFTISTKIETKVSRKPQRRYKKFQDRNPYNISVAYLVEMMTAKRRFEINWPLSAIGKFASVASSSMNTEQSFQ